MSTSIQCYHFFISVLSSKILQPVLVEKIDKLHNWIECTEGCRSDNMPGMKYKKIMRSKLCYNTVWVMTFLFTQCPTVSSHLKQWLTQWQDYWSLYQGNLSYLVPCQNQEMIDERNVVYSCYFAKIIKRPRNILYDNMMNEIIEEKYHNWIFFYIENLYCSLPNTLCGIWLFKHFVWRSSLFLVCWKHCDVF